MPCTEHLSPGCRTRHSAEEPYSSNVDWAKNPEPHSQEDNSLIPAYSEVPRYQFQKTRVSKEKLQYYLSRWKERNSRRTKKLALSLRVAARLDELSLLKNGWDEADALQIKSEALKAARFVLRGLSLLRPFQDPSIVPTFDGFLQLEWHKFSRSLEFEYTPEGWSILGVASVNSEHPVYNTASAALDDTEDLERFYIWYSTDELTWPSR
jgi:hypothetical protein